MGEWWLTSGWNGAARFQTYSPPARWGFLDFNRCGSFASSFLWALPRHTTARMCSSGCCGALLDPNTCQGECQTECQKECQKECQNICQIECQSRCQIECQNICQRECQKEYQNGCQAEWHIENQNLCQIECQKECQNGCQTECQNIC